MVIFCTLFPSTKFFVLSKMADSAEIFVTLIIVVFVVLNLTVRVNQATASSPVDVA